jgi:uncharacterized protein YjiS (DUF1127 family)
MTTTSIQIMAIGANRQAAKDTLQDTIQIVAANFHQFGDWRRQRQIEANALALSQHQLRDIGIHRP